MRRATNSSILALASTGEPLGLGLGAGDDLLRLALGLVALALVVGQQLRGLVLELLGLVEFGLDALGALVERFRDHAVDAEIAEQAEEHEKAQRHPEFCFMQHGQAL